MAFATPWLDAQPNQKPNIILVLSDDRAYSDIGCYGGGHPERFADHDIVPMKGRSLTGGFAADHGEERALLFEHFGKAAIRKVLWNPEAPTFIPSPKGKTNTDRESLYFFNANKIL